MNLNQNPQPVEPLLRDTLNLFKKEIMLELFSQHIGVIEEFDPETQTAKVSIVYTRTRFEEGPNGLRKPTSVKYPTLTGVPVTVIGGGPLTLRMPIAQGDECLLFINDRDFSRWYTNGDIGQPCESLRLHALSDAYAFVGVRNSQRVIEGYSVSDGGLFWPVDDETTVSHKISAETASINHGVTTVAAEGEKVRIENETRNIRTLIEDLITQLTTLNGHLQDLVTQTAAITVTGVTPGGGTSGPPANAAVITPIGIDIGAVTTELDAIKTQFGELLHS